MFNNRRGGGFVHSSSSVGQRRNPQLSNNFVSGGQLNQPKKPVISMPASQQNNQLSQQNNQPSQMQQQKQKKPLQEPQTELKKQPPPNLQAPSPVQPPSLVQPPTVQQQPLITEQPNSVKNEDLEIVDEVMTDAGDEDDRKPRKAKPFWIRKDGKINKKEQKKRRNQRLRKILQPKNALMVLNEIIGSTPYNLSDNLDMYEGTLFKCTVLVDGIEHTGVGKSKPSAKTAAAEAALKYMVLSKLKNGQPLDASPSTTTESANSDIMSMVDKPMEIDESIVDGISWSHVACYALHKLLSGWDEGTNLVEKLTQVTSGGGCAVPIPDHPQAFEKKPAKKLPPNANLMNPIMLLNQMQPLAVYEETSRTGNPPSVQFCIKCSIGQDVFFGTSTTKKGARKMCAFAACRKILGIDYTPEFLAEHGFTEDAVKYCPELPTPTTTA